MYSQSWFQKYFTSIPVRLPIKVSINMLPTQEEIPIIGLLLPGGTDTELELNFSIKIYTTAAPVNSNSLGLQTSLL